MLCAGKSLLGVEPEALEGKIAEAIEGARVAGREGLEIFCEYGFCC